MFSFEPILYGYIVFICFMYLLFQCLKAMPNINTGGKTQNIDFKQDIELLTDWALQVYTSVLQILKLCFECKQVLFNCLNVSDL